MAMNPNLTGYVVTVSHNGHLASHYTSSPWQAFIWTLQYAAQKKNCAVIDLRSEKMVNYTPEMGFQAYA